jgi:hypothetical protein
MIDRLMLDDVAYAQLEAAAIDLVSDAIAFAEASPWPVPPAVEPRTGNGVPR